MRPGASPPGGDLHETERSSDSGVAVGVESGSSRCGIDRVAQRPQTQSPDEQAGTVSREVERGTAIARAARVHRECQLRYRDVRDYTCTFSKRERIKGQRTPLQVLTMKVRTQPMSIYLKFRQPSPGAKPSMSSGATAARSWPMMWG